MSMVPGAATTPITATAVKMLSQLSQVRKYCERTAKYTDSAIRKMIRATDSGSRLASVLRATVGAGSVADINLLLLSGRRGESLDGHLVSGKVRADRATGHDERAVGDLHDFLVIGCHHEH